ncbi:MAG: M1 family metallopeptidase, partial [bacterium]|nr:M1 family metallopeptidase [bacterium]
EGKKLSLFFSGYLKPTQERMELFKSHDGLPPKIRATDPRLFYFLSNTQNFYPNPGDEFFKTDVTITLPGNLNCLASGSLVKQANQEDSSSYRFSSPATKGFSLVTGDFKLTKKLTAVTPIHFHSFDGFRYPKQLHLSELAEAVNLFSRDFGALDLPVINILIKKGRVEGGISNSGFIILNMVPSFKKKGYISGETLQLAGGATAIKKITNPILLRNRSEDHFIHELAHQWWGSLISWKTYRDVWITEGLAHFSLIYYLKQKMSPKKFNRMIKKFKKWVYRHSASGPIVYGTRIRLMESKSEVYQSVIYNKSAMVFLMAMEL